MSRHLWHTSSGTGSDDPPREAGLPDPRPAPEAAEPPPAPEESTVELPRCVEMDPTEPALSMLSEGRHGMR